MAVPFVSIAMITYNHSKYVLEGVNSSLSSSYPNIEVIVVDDGSTDDTWSILQSIKDSRLKIFTQKNQGPSSALNLAIEKCSGEYVFTISADDFMLPKHIETSLIFLKTHNLDVGFSLPSLINQEGEHLPDRLYPVFFGRQTSNSEDLLRSLFFGYNFLCASSAVFKREVFAVDRFRFDERILQLQDFKAWLELVQRYRIAINTERSIKYRVATEFASLSHAKNNGRLHFEFYLVYRDFIKNISEKALKILTSDEQARGINIDLPVQLLKAELCLIHTLRPIRTVGLELIYDFPGQLPYPNSDYYRRCLEVDAFRQNVEGLISILKRSIRASAKDLILVFVHGLLRFSKTVRTKTIRN